MEKDKANVGKNSNSETPYICWCPLEINGQNECPVPSNACAYVIAYDRIFFLESVDGEKCIERKFGGHPAYMIESGYRSIKVISKSVIGSSKRTVKLIR